MYALYHHLFHKEFPSTGPPWIHEWKKWPYPATKIISNQPHESATKRITVWAIRDPIDRYLSAFYSKIACCNPTSNIEIEKERKVCYGDKADHLAR